MEVKRSGRVSRYETEVSLIMDRWYCVLLDKIGHVKRLLHGRLRKRMRQAMSERVRNLESLLAARKLGRFIQQLLPDHSEPVGVPPKEPTDVSIGM